MIYFLKISGIITDRKIKDQEAWLGLKYETFQKHSLLIHHG